MASDGSSAEQEPFEQNQQQQQGFLYHQLQPPEPQMSPFRMASSDLSPASNPGLVSDPLPFVDEEVASLTKDEMEEEQQPNEEASKSSQKQQQQHTMPILRSKQSSRRNPWGNLSYADLITQAIQTSPEKRLTLAQIYDWLVKNVPYFHGKGDSISSIGWKVDQDYFLAFHFDNHLLCLLELHPTQSVPP